MKKLFHYIIIQLSLFLLFILGFEKKIYGVYAKSIFFTLVFNIQQVSKSRHNFEKKIL